MILLPGAALCLWLTDLRRQGESAVQCLCGQTKNKTFPETNYGTDHLHFFEDSKFLASIVHEGIRYGYAEKDFIWGYQL